MKKTNEQTSLNEHVKKMMYRSNYRINESPKYKTVIDGDNMEFDEIPQNIHSTQDGQPMPNAGGGTDAFLEEAGNQQLPPEDNMGGGEQPPVPEPTNAPAPGQTDVPPAEVHAPPAPAGGEELPPEGEENAPVDAEVPVEQPPIPEVNPERKVNQIQNEVIKHNIEAMKSLQMKLEDLEKMNLVLSSQLDVMNAKVKEVEEPTDAEKLMAKKDVSYPFYFNLDDVWKGNWYDQKNGLSTDRGIKQLPDGTYVADFDDLPPHNDIDINDSFFE